MLDRRRIKEAENNVRSYLDEGLLKKTTMNKQIMDVLLRNAKESLRVAEEVHQRGFSELWVIVCSYYAMYYYANAVLLKIGYKVGNKIVHRVTSDALIVFVRNKLKENFIEDFEEAKEEALELAGVKADEIIESFEFERIKRTKFQYEMAEIVKKTKAETSLNRAKKFVFEMEKLLAGTLF